MSQVITVSRVLSNWVLTSLANHLSSRAIARTFKRFQSVNSGIADEHGCSSYHFLAADRVYLTHTSPHASVSFYLTRFTRL